MRWLAAVLAICVITFAPAVVHAGDYHAGTTLVCSDCHTMHYSSSHEYNTGGYPPAALGPNGPYPRLLRNETNELCLTCHDSKPWAPDVFGVNGGTPGVREAGGLNADPAASRANDANFAEIDGHTLWSTKTAPGGTFNNSATGLLCTDCHSAHGAPTQYRNMRSSTRATSIFYNKFVTYNKDAAGTNDLTKDVFQRNALAYTIDDVDFNEPVATASAYGAWCQSCHTNFHGTSLSSNMNNGSDWLRHPTADANLGSFLTTYTSRTNRVKVMDPTGNWATPSANMTPTCFTCHKAHGNENGYGLIYMNGAGAAVTEQGDTGGQFRDLCKQCHTQGG